MRWKAPPWATWIGNEGEGDMFIGIETEPADPLIHEAAITMARRCRHVVQACLREEEWRVADQKFYLVIREGLERLWSVVPDVKRPVVERT